QDPAESCLLMWDNARPHTPTDTREFLTRRDMEPVKQSSNSPDLNLCDRFLFRKTSWGPRGGYTRRSRAMRRVSEDELSVGGDYVY
ncbi:Hypothetical protein FKW44_002517, partial [Caligus rogercresseyi]